MTTIPLDGKVVDLAVVDVRDLKINTKYCVTRELHERQVKENSKRGLPPIPVAKSVCYDACAVVCSGPSLSQTWNELKQFSNIITCSGAHDFLIERGIVPTWHMETDPRQHKSTFVKKPHNKVQYLIASCCHPDVFESLKNYNVNIWHVFNDGSQTPRGHWALTGGSNVGMRALVMARVLGFVNVHVFGMDCSCAQGKFHANDHPNEPKEKGWMTVKVGNLEFTTTQVFLEYARQFFRETLMIADTQFTLHGDGLLQALVAHRSSDPVLRQKDLEERSKQQGKEISIALCTPQTISDEYAAQNRRLHEERPDYGASGSKRAETVAKLAKSINARSILDYGCGKGELAAHLPFPIWEYDPAVPGKDGVPRPAELVVCTDVLEHVEPDFLENTLMDLARCTQRLCYLVIHTGPAAKNLPDGRNTHLIQQNASWWKERLSNFFHLSENSVIERPPMLHIVATPKQKGIP